MVYELNYKRYSEKAILIEWPSKIDENILDNLVFCKNQVEIHFYEVIVEVISSYNSLLIYYRFTIEDFYSEVFRLKSLFSDGSETGSRKTKLWKIPVCYSSALAPDLEQFAEMKSLSVDEVVRLHTTPIYKVYFIGFLPGFLYLGGLNEVLFHPRKKTPSPKIEKGSVAIGGNQTGVYPVDSPGGWYAIGKSPLSFFNASVEECCFVSLGDRIQFISISEKEYNDIRTLVNENLYTPTFKLESWEK